MLTTQAQRPARNNNGILMALKPTSTDSAGSLQRLVRRTQRIHTAISLLESACLTLERAENDGMQELCLQTRRWCKQIRAEQQKLVRELDAVEAALLPPNDKAQRLAPLTHQNETAA